MSGEVHKWHKSPNRIRYHIGEDGIARECHANVGACPVSNIHYDTVQEAQRAYERTCGNTIPTLKKSSLINTLVLPQGNDIYSVAKRNILIQNCARFPFEKNQNMLSGEIVERIRKKSETQGYSLDEGINIATS